MIRRYTLLGGAIALMMAVLYAIWRSATRDLRRLQKLVDALSERDYGTRARLQRPGVIGSLGRSLDALADRLSMSEQKKRSRKDRLRTPSHWSGRPICQHLCCRMGIR